MRAPLALAVALGVALLAAGSCKDKQAPSSVAASGSAAVIDWNACDAALRAAPHTPPNKRIATILDGCHVCGDWTPILRWNTPQTSGGPTRAEIEAAMVRCSAFCTGDSKLKFLGTLDDARGTSSRTPWRQLGDICKDKVSAVPDNRFIGAPYFALDRIARAVFAHGGDVATHAGKVVVTLPPTTAVGTSIDVPVVATGLAPSLANAIVLSYVGGDIYFDELPTATLTAAGVQISIGATTYPGRKEALADLPAQLREAYRGRPRSEGAPPTVLIVTPPATLASALVPIIGAADPVAEVRLAVTTSTEDADWPVLAATEVSLAAANPTVKLGPDTTAQQLATILEKQAASGATQVGVTTQ